VILRAIAALIVIASTSRMVVPRERLAVEHVQLGNGLHVILSPDQSAASVAVHVRYQSGAASERADETGYTHLLELLLGEGSVHVKDFTARVDATGGWATTTATSDYLGMTEQVPAHALELVLWLEAERMAGLADGITAAGVAHAREVIAAEWRAAYVDDPYALVDREVKRALWSGVRDGAAVLAEIKAADVETVRRFARERLVPNNATLVIAGRFDSGGARKLVERYFGWIPPRELVPVVHTKIEPRKSALSVTVKDPVAKVVVAFRCEPFTGDIDVIGQVLAGGSASRLASALVDTGLASEVHAELTRQRAAELRLVATPVPGVDAARVVQGIHDELARLRAHPPSSVELRRARMLLITESRVAMENHAVRAEMLASWAVHGSDDSLISAWPGMLHGHSDDIKPVIERWLGERAAVTVIGRPEGT
jgi:zinc protease